MYQSEKLINNLYDAIVFWLTEWSVKNPKNNKEIYFWKEGQDNTEHVLLEFKTVNFENLERKKNPAQLYEYYTRTGQHVNQIIQKLWTSSLKWN